MHENSNRLKEDTFKTRARQNHVTPWVSVHAKQYTRLVPSQLLMEFFTFKHRFMDFKRYQIKLDQAIHKIGRF